VLKIVAEMVNRTFRTYWQW